MNAETPIVTGTAICSVRAATVFVDNPERALQFYVDKLGFEQRADVELDGGLRWTEVAPANAAVALVLVHPSLTTMGAERASWARQRIGEPTGVVLETEDVEAAYRELRARGVEFTGGPAPHAWGAAAATFRDPDGNEFLLVEASRT